MDFSSFRHIHSVEHFDLFPNFVSESMKIFLHSIVPLFLIQTSHGKGHDIFQRFLLNDFEENTKFDIYVFVGPWFISNFRAGHAYGMGVWIGVSQRCFTIKLSNRGNLAIQNCHANSVFSSTTFRKA